MQPHEVAELVWRHPDLAERIMRIEQTVPYLDTIDGLWRKPVKGMRGATPRPGSMTEFILELVAGQLEKHVRSLPVVEA